VTNRSTDGRWRVGGVQRRGLLADGCTRRERKGDGPGRGAGTLGHIILAGTDAAACLLRGCVRGGGDWRGGSLRR